MSARTRARVDTNQPDESCSLRDDGTVERTRLNPARPWQSLESDTLRWRWQAAASQSNNLPPFEELALDSLGGMADNVAFCKWTKPASFRSSWRGGFLKAGSAGRRITLRLQIFRSTGRGEWTSVAPHFCF